MLLRRSIRTHCKLLATKTAHHILINIIFSHEFHFTYIIFRHSYDEFSLSIYRLSVVAGSLVCFFCKVSPARFSTQQHNNTFRQRVDQHFTTDSFIVHTDVWMCVCVCVFCFRLVLKSPLNEMFKLSLLYCFFVSFAATQMYMESHF